ncbi:hypothetical protein SS1G_13289 [Sclerotinia sclerotiorum 1980 UF-70]|uniref:WIBG Mago-binding domain-containing protein n=2 Tax=Sclerotinia sclerotiorum (strain ATCC 18683 / 1980 / Ss-1) TaxID=665079 RepID=A7F6R0_SCLS1|nr:hypothetical protein SS1G_13289 [Sclerotinia sclerotiorum 1980 UF-70]APA08355.1 hypothetical protein sscle_03g031250 [Sclerotinia sclerotiorum 1980 UF-70]EDN98431.1 hypothetical protein SS1G_13289 [Sclerotinia sclerotiorum 1980 UF-70]
MPSVPTPSKAGIVETQTGDRHIPSSTRADGTKRKEIKIRPGYKPPEDVEVYKNRTAETWKNRGSRGPPGAEGLKDDTSTAGSAASNKNAKRREARKKAAENSKEGSGEVKGSQADNWRDGKKDVEVEKKEEVDPEAEREKKARNLKKKLKQAKDLKEKSQQDGAKLLPEQFAKVIKINELIRELDLLGFDADGEPKAKDDVKDIAAAAETLSLEDTKE